MTRKLKNHLNDLNLKEQKLLRRKSSPIRFKKIEDLYQQIESRIPVVVEDALSNAFYHGLKLVFNQGEWWIEKTFSKNKLKIEFDIADYALSKKVSNKHIKNLDKQAKNVQFEHSSIAMIEGSVLGLLGIGLPDIPVLIAVLLRSIYEVALSYGFDAKDSTEKEFILLILCAAVSKGTQRIDYSHQIDELVHHPRVHALDDAHLDQLIKETSERLKEAMLVGKFVQGIAIIGVVGGVLNVSIQRKVTRFAMLKYKKRYLINRLKQQEL